MIYSIGERRLEATGKFWVAESADVIGSAVLGENVSIWFNAVVRADTDTITTGDNSNIQDGAVLHVDPGQPLVIGEGVTVGHNAMLHGCTVGDNSVVGINAVVLNRAVIGKNCIIGANALVPGGMVVRDNSLVLGAPGKVVRELTEAQQQMTKLGAMHYAAHCDQYRDELKVDDRFDDQ